ncbi:CRISPR-associated endonuclease Cas1 [Helicobacter cetorum]|uniref:CRISPR-associated endonuclease Cas1 n=1 Tax=Helicobacter cetorum TaxID=138563 RepID=UPI000CF0D2AB|nr:CRISPR-associated endonuclease Cas1 [Helicobacter cetorum]
MSLCIATFGVNLSLSKDKLIAKKQGKIIQQTPLNKLEQIIIENPSTNLSSLVIYACAKRKIPIIFIEDLKPLATIFTYQASNTQIIHKQALLLHTSKHLYLAKQFIRSKSLNQLNFLKYLNKYHKNLDEIIFKIQSLTPKVSKAKEVSELFGIEGIISANYWQGISQVIKFPFKRVKKGANDAYNSAFNYAYAILYSKVQVYLLQAGLSLHISFLHAINSLKPTLVFDVIEEFRAFMVDRVIVSMINKKESLRLDDNKRLSLESRKRISQNMRQKFQSLSTYKKQPLTCEKIIELECNALAKFIQEDSKSYKPFIGKY